MATAQRELLEESGYVSEDRQLLGTYTVSAAKGIANVHVFGAQGAAKQQEPCSGDLEDSVVELLGRERLVAAVHDDGVVVAGSLCGGGARAAWITRVATGRNSWARFPETDRGQSKR